MCLILLDWDPEGDHPLTVLANRDELHARGALQAHFWEDHPYLLAGRDAREGGTWLGVTANGRFAAVTNFRSVADMQPGQRSRGELTVGFLTSKERSEAYLERVLASGSQWAGFNLLLFDGVDLVWGS
ncbi:MAG: NRDE family protein, partial [Bacteroidetes bacterium]|nr:NRDE family protein [Bacteroidota bacterium]